MDNGQKIVFIGGNQTGLKCLQALHEAGVNVAGVLTLPKAIDISFSANPLTISRHAPIAEFAESRGWPLITVTGKMSGYRAALESMAPDLIVVCGWYYLLPKRILEIPRLGVVGFHPSLLPKYRGAAPLNWAIICGEEKTGVSLFYLDSGVDSGDIIAQAEVKIDIRDTIADVYQKIDDEIINLAKTEVPRILRNTALRRAQSHEDATCFPPRLPDDGRIDWRLTSREIYDWIRAQTDPYPGAFSLLDGQKLMCWEARLLERPNNRVPGMAGYVFRVVQGRGVEVLTGDGSMELSTVGFPGGERHSADCVLTHMGMRLR